MFQKKSHFSVIKYLPVAAGIFITIFMSTVWTSCTYHNLEDLTPPVVCDTSNITYAAVVKPIFQKNCYACHSIATAHVGSDDIDLETFTGLQVWVSHGSLSPMLCDIKHEGCRDMPLDAPKLSDCDIAFIETWILAGAPNN